VTTSPLLSNVRHTPASSQVLCVPRMWSRYSNFRLRLKTSNFFGCGSTIPNCFSSGSTALLRTRLIHISPSYWTIYRSFEIIIERELSIGLQFKYNVLKNPLLQKTVSSIWIMF